MNVHMYLILPPNKNTDILSCFDVYLYMFEYMFEYMNMKNRKTLITGGHALFFPEIAIALRYLRTALPALTIFHSVVNVPDTTNSHPPVERGSMQVVQHLVIYSLERNISSHEGLQHLHNI
jgi:hypothetical protein